MVSASSIAHFNSAASADASLETVEIDPQYAQALGFAKGDVVEIGLLHDLPFAKSVTTEPATPDDWEILELHADHVEATLLSQVRVASVGQEIDVWVMGRTRIRLIIEGLNPPEAKALLLTTDTEFAIAPKARQQKPLGSSNATKSAVEADASAPSIPASTTTKGYSRLSRVLPASVLPFTLPTPTDLQSVIYISHRSLRALAYEGKIPPDIDHLKAIVRRLASPSDPADDTNTPGRAGADAPEQNKILDLKANDKEKKVDEDRRSKHTWEAVVRGLEEIPDRQIVVVGMLDGIQDWDIVQSIAEVVAISSNGRSLTSEAVTYYVDLSKWTEKPISTIQQQFRYWLDKALWHRPSVLLFDNMDKLLSAEVEHADSSRTRHLANLFVSLFSSMAHDISRDTTGVIMLATAESLAALHPLLNTLHVFKEVFHLRPPDRKARKEIMNHLVQLRLQSAHNMVVDPTAPLNFAALAAETEGYSATDLQDLVARAVHNAAMRLSQDSQDDDAKLVLTAADFKAAHVGFVPLSLRDIPLQQSNVEWTDVGGLSQTKRVLRETLEWPTKYAAIFAQSPLRLRSGILLYGYPGCGKTLLASAVAKECGLNFISVKGPELLNKYIGASEKSVRDIFERASAAKPCVLFFDEFDSIAPKRGHDSTGVTDRVVNQLLTLLDGAEGLEGVYVLAATRPY
ncbi:hypothetical protein EWM64_g1986 [Hericium alpestre]|uniref:Peroxisomal ATPase PEX1 n=1 Tax=Hericium alpestre TaxID=135208 RepID=A0A4Z0A4R8_9AGAM|nr:hypothetical protein EWM64_g1986 [Hericium alpestre]